MIKEINETDNDGVYVWDATSRSGDKVASGVYIYIISNCDSSGKLIDKKIGRLVIIR